MDYGNSNKATVMKYDGTSWGLVGSAAFSANVAYYESLSFSPDGTPYVVYTDYANSNKATVMKYDGTSWVLVGNAGFSVAQAAYTSLSFSPDGTPYVAYEDYGNSFKATVMKYTGTSWVPVGSAGFSAGEADYESLSFSPDGTPYLAYENSYNSKAAVMKFNGTSWVPVGSAGFSAGSAYYESLSFSPDGTPYLAYEDVSNSLKATVMKYNGTSWVPAGSAAFSANVAYYESLSFSPDGTPYLAYQDYGNGYGATVMKLVALPTATTDAAGSITGTGATLNGTVNDDGVATTIAFEYGTTTSYGTTVAATAPIGGNLAAGSGSTASSVALTGLTPGTTYHFRIDATGNGTTVNGSDATFTTTPLPTVTGISPASGSAVGGTSVILTGTNFTGASNVSFGSTAASYTVNSATQITATSPAGVPGAVDVIVTTPGGSSASSAADQFTYEKWTPTVTAGSPSVIYGTSSATLTASVAYTGPTAPTGGLTFTVNGASTGVGAVTCTGTASPLSCSASYNTASLAANNYPIVATEAADSNYIAASNATSASLTVTPGTAAITFNVANHTYGDASFSVSASSFSTGAFTYTVVSGPATISGNTVTLTGGGTVVLKASQAADSNYLASSQNASFTVGAGTAAISFAVANHTYGDASFSVSASSSSTGAFTYTVVSGPATIAGNTVTLTGAGTVVLKASQAADSNYLANSQNASFTVGAGTAAISFTVANHTYGDASFVVSANSSSTGAFTYTVVSGPATISGNIVTLTGAGTVVLKASQAADSNYLASSQNASFTVGAGTAPISFTVANHTFGDAPLALTATSSSTGAFTYTVVSGPAAIAGNTVTLTGAGTVVLKASQAADSNYLANSQNATFTVAAGTAPITFNVPNHTYGDAPFALTATSSSTGAFIYTVVSGPATISGNTVTLTGAGTVVLKASQAADSNYLASSQNASFTVGAGTAPITFAVANHTFGDTPFAVSASSLSTGAFTYTVVSGPAAIVGNTVALTGAGTVVLKASQVADANYDANSQNATFTVAAGTAAITFTVANHTFGDAPFAASSSSSSTGAFTYTVVSGPATISGNIVTLTGAGTVVLKASQAADSNHAANSQNATFTVAAGTAVITFTVANHTYGDTPFAVTASSSSTGAFTYTVVSGPATISGNIVTLTGAGTVVLKASQAADSSYAANSQNATFTVEASLLTLTANNATRYYGATNPAFTGTVSGQKNGDTFAESFSTSAVATSAPGTYSIVPTVSGTNLTDYTVTASNGVLTITQAPTTTGLAISATQVTPVQPVTLTITVASTTSDVPSGTVAITDNGVSLTTVPLSNGTATYTTLLAPGVTHALVGTYSGDTGYLGSASNASATVITVAPLQFALTNTETGTFTAAPGTTANYSFKISPNYGSYPAAVTFSVTGLPSGATASFSPATFPANAGTQTVTLSVKLPQAIGLNQTAPRSVGHTRAFFALLLLPLIGSGKLRRKLRGRVLMALLLCAGITGATVLTGCGSDSGFLLQQPSSYALTITATSGSISQSQVVTLIVQ